MPSDALVNDVQTAVDPEENHGGGYGIAPIGHFVKIKPAVWNVINITTDITYDDGYSPEDVRTYINRAIDDYFLSLKKEWKTSDIIVRIAQIEARILAIDGIIDIEQTKLNGAAENVSMGYAEVPKRGTVNGV